MRTPTTVSGGTSRERPSMPSSTQQQQPPRSCGKIENESGQGNAALSLFARCKRSLADEAWLACSSHRVVEFVVVAVSAALALSPPCRLAASLEGPTSCKRLSLHFHKGEDTTTSMLGLLSNTANS